MVKYILQPEFYQVTFDYTVRLPYSDNELPGVEPKTIAHCSEVVVDTVCATDDTSHTYCLTVTAADGVSENKYRIRFVNYGVAVDRNQQRELRVYPNPFSSSFSIEMKDNETIRRVALLILDGKTERILDQLHRNTVTYFA